MNLGGKQIVGMKARFESECFPHTISNDLSLFFLFLFLFIYFF